MNAHSKGDVPVSLTIEDNFVGPLEGFWVMVGGRKIHQNPVPFFKGEAIEFNILLANTRHGDR